MSQSFIRKLARTLTEDPDVYEDPRKTRPRPSPNQDSEPGEVSAFDDSAPEEASMKPIEPNLPERVQEDNSYISGLLAPVLNSKFFGENGRSHANLQSGSDTGRLMVVTGDDGRGKSALLKLMNKYCSRSGMECFSSHGNVGVESIKATKEALENAKMASGPNVVILNEPGAGLSDSYKQALGQYIADQYAQLSANTKLVMIISHSRAIIEAMLDLQPAHLRLGDNYDLKDVASGKIPAKTVQDLMKLGGY